ncbi:MAG: glycosyltransferase family 4 protein [Lentisphaerae bacterium]|nr:glycosyltransferase family 4 protein [Lentisphaerota bacterium]
MHESPRIAIASCGLGHVSRGIETWARDTAVALAARGAEATLFAGGDLQLDAGAAERLPLVVVLPCLRRFDARTQRRVAMTPSWAWRWGLKDGYGWEQFSFWLRLQRELRRGRFDVLHVQDPLLANWCRRWREWGWLRTQEILAHGTEEPPAFLAPFPCVQHLAPWHLQESRRTLGPAAARPHWVAIPNFVDTDVFRPAPDAFARQDVRRRLNIPAGALLVGCVAVVKKHHKRIDYLIREFAQALQRSPTSAMRDAHLVIAGARQPESDELVQLAQALAPGRVQVLFDLSRDAMPAFYQALDVFALSSLFEMMPIALLEALSTGVPVLVNRHPVLEWMAGLDSPTGGEGAAPGPGGASVDMAAEGALATALAGLTPSWCAQFSRNARRQAETRFARAVVIEQYLAYYATIGTHSSRR